MAEGSVDQELTVAQHPIAGGDARRSQAGRRNLERQLVIEVREGRRRSENLPFRSDEIPGVAA